MVTRGPGGKATHVRYAAREAAAEPSRATVSSCACFERLGELWLGGLVQLQEHAKNAGDGRKVACKPDRKGVLMGNCERLFVTQTWMLRSADDAVWEPINQCLGKGSADDPATPLPRAVRIARKTRTGWKMYKSCRACFVLLCWSSHARLSL
jgi:hypothetical protein